jgi:hypothetical protein
MQSTHPLPCDGLNTLPGIPAADLAFDNSITLAPTSVSDSGISKNAERRPATCPQSAVSGNVSSGRVRCARPDLLLGPAILQINRSIQSAIEKSQSVDCREGRSDCVCNRFPYILVFAVREQSKGLMGGGAFPAFRIRFPFFVRRRLGQYMPELQIQSV